MSSSLSRALLHCIRPGRMREFRRLERDQWLPADELAARSRERLASLLRYACAQVPFYREFCSQAGLDPARIGAEDLTRFPPLTKHDLMDRQERFLSLDRSPAERMPNNTGGSSGVWFKFFVEHDIRDQRAANTMRADAWTGWRPGDRQAVLWGHPREAKAARSRRRRLLGALVHRSVRLNAYDMDDAVLADFARQLSAWRPAMIRGYASALAFLADYMGRQGVAMPRPRGIVSAAETLTDDYRAAIESYFGCKVLNRYGSREFSNMAQQCEEVGGLHVFTDRVHLEILRPDGTACEPSERGEIVVTDLGNRVMPFIRYRTGDLARGQDGGCPCGRGFPLLAAVEGRTSELIVGKNGKYYSCQSPRLFGADIPGIGQMQLIQETLDRVEVKVVPEAAWDEASRAKLAARMHGLLGDIDLTISLVEKIPLAPSGKFPFTISKVSPFGG